MVGFGHGHNHENVSIGRTCYLSMCEHLFVVVSLVYFFYQHSCLPKTSVVVPDTLHLDQDTEKFNA